MTNPNYRPRLSIDITEAQSAALYKHLSWGEKKRLFTIVIDDLITAFDKYGADKIIGAMKAREINAMNLIKFDLKEPHGHS